MQPNFWCQVFYLKTQKNCQNQAGFNLHLSYYSNLVVTIMTIIQTVHISAILLRDSDMDTGGNYQFSYIL